MTDPVFLVALPLVASIVPAALALGRERAGWAVAVAVLLADVVLAVAIAAEAVATGRVVSDVGGVPAPVGIRLVVDALSAPFVVLVPASALVVLAYTRRAGPHSGPFHSLFLLLVAGLAGVCVTADAFNLYVFLEIGGLAAYALVASAPGGAAALAALRYLLLGTVGATLYLLGVGYAYAATGTLSMAALSTALAAAPPRLALAPFGLMAVGLGVKMALYPLHTWKPAAYAAAPTGVTALLAALASTVAAYALARLLVSAFTVAYLARFPVVRPLLLAAATVSVLAGSLLALRSQDVTRLLAYSSTAQFGVVLVGIAVATPTSLAGSVVHLVGHGATKAGAFLAVGLLATTRDVRTVEDYAGLADRAPFASAAVAVLALGLVGIPPTVGFAGTLYVALGAIEAGAWVGATAVLLSTLLSLTYFGRLLERVFFHDATGGGDDSDEPDAAVPTGATLSILVAVVASLGLGVAAVAVEGWLSRALEALL